MPYTIHDKVRELKTSQNPNTRILILDYPGSGGACHEYQLEDSHPAAEFQGGLPFAKIKFQKGPIKENGVNGCHQEDLIAIVIDRLQDFQAGEFACRENALALTKLQEALHWLEHRTKHRQKRGVEGTNIK